jgi:hypothetical protein
MVAVLEVAAVLVATVTVMVLLLDPLVGETTAHAESEAAVQEVLEVTVMVVAPAVAAIDCEIGVRVVGPARLTPQASTSINCTRKHL